MGDTCFRISNPLLLPLTLFGLLFIVRPATAQSTPPNPADPGNFYISVGPAISHFDLPNWGYGSADITVPSGQSALTFKDIDGELYGGEITGGYVFSEGATPSWLGKNVRVELSPSFYWGHARDRVSATVPVTSGTIAVDGTAPASFLPDLAAKLSAQYYAARGTLRLISDLDAGILTLSPSFALFGAGDRQQYRVTMVSSLAGVSFVDTAKERVNNGRFGAELGLLLNLPVFQQIALAVGGNFGVVYVHSKLHAKDCTDALVTTPGCDGDFSTASITADRDFVSYHGLALWGIIFPVLGAKLSLLGEYRNDFAPKILNPTRTGVRASLKEGRVSSLGGRLVLTVPFN
jgi:hypothetical protein